MSMEHCWNEGEKREGLEMLKEKPVPVPLFSPQTIHGLAWDQTQAFGERLVINCLSHGITEDMCMFNLHISVLLIFHV